MFLSCMRGVIHADAAWISNQTNLHFAEALLGLPALHRRRHLSGPITDEGVAVGGAFDSDAATGMMPAAQRVAGVLASWRS
jgi:hypothetical protein